ncbi:hypothetical protein C8R45DRAFT_381046 [Mycena sanguinolenta]|nr:hypothetical protein C8R45DRAFT_381046 [Mycena sanguinolenta]
MMMRCLVSRAVEYAARAATNAVRCRGRTYMRTSFLVRGASGRSETMRGRATQRVVDRCSTWMVKLASEAAPRSLRIRYWWPSFRVLAQVRSLPFSLHDAKCFTFGLSDTHGTSLFALAATAVQPRLELDRCPVVLVPACPPFAASLTIATLSRVHRFSSSPLLPRRGLLIPRAQSASPAPSLR